MKRLKKEKIKKIRTTITLDEDLFIESGLYIENLSGYLNECLKRAVESAKKKEEQERLRIIDIRSTSNCNRFDVYDYINKNPLKWEEYYNNHKNDRS